MKVFHTYSRDGKDLWALVWKSKKIFAHKDKDGVIRFFNRRRYLWDEEVSTKWLFAISMEELNRLSNG